MSRLQVPASPVSAPRRLLAVLPEGPRAETLSDFFAWSVATFGQRPALEFNGHVLTYQQLQYRANRLARELHARGVKRGDFVVLHMPRGIELYVGFLAILEAGAAYVPVDAHCPVERLDFIAGDCGAKVVLTHSDLVSEALKTPALYIDELERAVAPAPARPSEGARPADVAYVIYTSGSTGHPKGVMVSHRSICHLIRAEGSVLKIAPADVVFQGFSAAFDMSLEEIWTAFFAGAKLLAASDEVMQSGADLWRYLDQHQVSVLHCVPSLLALQEPRIPSLRLLNLGGESCPDFLVKRWHRPGLRMLNTYGPTETTVTATYATLHPDEPVTIGVPLPGYSAFILDQDLREVAPGDAGELCIGGPGLATGYVGQPELTKAKFIRLTRRGASQKDVAVYRTGDLARYTPAHQLEFLGRIDTQVKIRGFRVELAEIESVLMELAAVSAAVAAKVPDAQGNDALVAFLVLRRDTELDGAALWGLLKARLPSYMVPEALEVLPELPRLLSGKVNRNLLAYPKAPLRPQSRREAPTTPLEREIHAVWTRIFAPSPVGVTDDFFLDLGGHSLKVASAVSQLRALAGLESLSIQEMYRHPTVRRLAEARRASVQAPRAAPVVFHAVPRKRYVACCAGQAVGLGVVFSIMTAQWYVPLLAYWAIADAGGSVAAAFGAACAAYSVMIPVVIAFAILAKWTVIGRYREGDYPLWGFYFWRWWFVRRVQALVPNYLMAGTPLMGVYLRLLGARIGAGAFVGSNRFDAPDLLSIGSGSSIGRDAFLSNCAVEQGLLRIRRVAVGRDCFVGTMAALGLGSRMEDGSQLGELSLLANAAVIPRGESWAGSPAVSYGRAPDGGPTPARAAGAFGRHSRFGRSVKRVLVGGLLSVLALALPAVASLPALPGLWWLLTSVRSLTTATLLAQAPLQAALFVVLMCLMITVLKWLVLGRVRAGRLAVDSFGYVRYWFVSRLMDISLVTVYPMYASLFLPPWLRTLGVRIGRAAEVSTASSIHWDLLTIGEESFVADAVTLGVPRVEGGWVHLQPTSIGRRTFLGNSAVVPAGTHLGNGVLVGCLSVPPQAPPDHQKNGSSWFGSPAIFLPSREVVTGFAEATTYRPTRLRYATRMAIEFTRIIFVPTCTWILGLGSLVTLISLRRAGIGPVGLVAILPALSAVVGLLAVLATVVVKRSLIGRYQRTVRPLWSGFVWRSEFATCVYETIAVPFFLEHLRGTPFLNVMLRWMGAKIGARVYTDTTDITEHDLVAVGDDAALNEDCGLQTHLFEDRVMKVSAVSIAPRATVGAASIVLYDSHMACDAQLGDLSILMKGESLPAGTQWAGSPAQELPAPAAPLALS